MVCSDSGDIWQWGWRVTFLVGFRYPIRSELLAQRPSRADNPCGALVLLLVHSEACTYLRVGFGLRVALG